MAEGGGFAGPLHSRRWGQLGSLSDPRSITWEMFSSRWRKLPDERCYFYVFSPVLAICQAACRTMPSKLQNDPRKYHLPGKSVGAL